MSSSPWSPYRVGIKPVRGLHGAMRSGNVGEGVLVTSGKFTREARDFAGEQRISLIDGDELLAEITALLPEKALALLKLATQGRFPHAHLPVLRHQDDPAQEHPRTAGRTWAAATIPAASTPFTSLPSTVR
jgi:hypothetical protein